MTRSSFARYCVWAYPPTHRYQQLRAERSPTPTPLPSHHHPSVLVAHKPWWQYWAADEAIAPSLMVLNSSTVAAPSTGNTTSNSSGTTLSVHVACGEREPLTVALRVAPDDVAGVKQLENVSLSGLPAPMHVVWHSVRYKFSRASEATFASRPLYYDPLHLPLPLSHNVRARVGVFRIVFFFRVASCGAGLIRCARFGVVVCWFAPSPHNDFRRSPDGCGDGWPYLRKTAPVHYPHVRLRH